MTLNDYRQERLSLDEFAEWQPTSHVLDIFKCSKCGHLYEGNYQYVISGHKVWQYATTCPGCGRTMLGVVKEYRGE